MATDPQTLQEAIIYFADPKNCNEFLAGLRWTDGKPRCPQCDSDHVIYLEKQNRYKCYGKHPRAQFSLKVGTIFEDSPVSLDKWLVAMWLVVNCKNGISSCEIAKDLGVSQKSAWFMDHRIRMALHDGSVEKASGHVEADETFIGVRRETCTSLNAVAASLEPEPRTRPPSWAFLNAAERSALQS